jgi:hypothetical protein
MPASHPTDLAAHRPNPVAHPFRDEAFPHRHLHPRITCQLTAIATRWVPHTPPLRVGSLLFFGLSSRAQRGISLPVALTLPARIGV